MKHFTDYNEWRAWSKTKEYRNTIHPCRIDDLCTGGDKWAYVVDGAGNYSVIRARFIRAGYDRILYYGAKDYVLERARADSVAAYQEVA